ncbi:orexin receptor type 2 [Elysia marginata]|uniref:Orexin receptor type 2 n=1 Tax=Elysia marginata TaxID=1093978 RepID=A0AAV4H3F9_9GAST|nr:orexin receptor type 2 [Elysia marginata]
MASAETDLPANSEASIPRQSGDAHVPIVTNLLNTIISSVINASHPDFFNSSANSTNSTNSSDCWNEYCWTWDEYDDHILEFIRPKHYEIVFIIIYCITFVVGLVGNALVCFAVWRNHNMRTVTNVFIVNLAVGDFLVILVCLPPTLVLDVIESWFLDPGTCKCVLYLQSASVAVSVLTLSAIAVERWWAICYPLRFKSTLPRARKIIILIWVVALLCALPEAITTSTVETAFPANYTSPYLIQCKPLWDPLNQGIYQIVQSFVFYVLPMGLMALTYTHIASVLWKHEIPGVVVSSKNYGQSRKYMLDSNRNSQDDQIISRRKAARMLIAIVIMFGICYLPVHLMNVLRYFGIQPIKHDNLIIQNLISHWLPYFNSAINPIIYNFMSAKFRKEFKVSCYCCFYGIKHRPRTRRDPTFTMTFSHSNYSNCHTEEVTMASM